MILKQTEFCQALYGDYQHKKKKKKFGEVASIEPFEVTRADAGNIILSYFDVLLYVAVLLSMCMCCQIYYHHH